jgi:tetratricopeptide (TPR) repeat protein
VLQLRVGSYLDSGDFQKATDTLLLLLKAQGGEKGQMFVLAVLQKLDEDFKKAGALGDKPRMTQLAGNRAKLSDYLVDWAKKSTNADVNKRVYGYTVFSAEAKLAAAEMSGDKAQLDEARKAFENLLGPDMTKLYQKELEGNAKADKNFPHPNALLGLGKAAFAQGDYEVAVSSFGKLLNAKKLGTAKIQKLDPRNPAEPMYIDNEPYWEAWYKFLDSKFELFNANKANPKAIADFDDAKGALKRLYIIQNPPGGEKWSPEFEELHKKYIPDFDPKTLVPTSQPAETQPAGSQPASAPVAAGPSVRAKGK